MRAGQGGVWLKMGEGFPSPALMKSPNRVGLWSHDLQVVLPTPYVCKFIFITELACILFQCFCLNWIVGRYRRV